MNDPAVPHFGRTLWPSDMRRAGRDHSANDLEIDPDEDRRGNLISPPAGGAAPTPDAGEGARRRRRRRQGRGRRRRSDHAGQAPPSEHADADRGEAAKLEPAEIVRRYIDAVQEGRMRAHQAHRRAAGRLGTPAFVESVEDWGRHWTGKGRKETLLGKARIDGDRAMVETTGEGFGPVRYRLAREDGSWRLDAVEGVCTDCEGAGQCAVCGGETCDACENGTCPACRGASWVPYRK